MIQETLLMEAAKPVISSLVKNVITPQIQKFAEKVHIAYNELLIPRGEHFEEYFYRTFKKYSILNTLVFKNEQRLLKDLYIPLTIVKDDCQINKNKERTKIDKYPAELIKNYSKILITDTAGMGKSTLTKRLFLDVIENGYGIPIYIEMRRLKKDRSVLLEIQEQINSLTKEFDSNLLLEFIHTGGFVFFLDGYDEISLEDRIPVTTNLQDFVSKAGNNVFILTSRPEQALSSFGDFQSFTIDPLTKREAYELLRRYDNQGQTSRQLIEELKSGQYEMINEFLKNPLLVSLLFAAFDYKQTIPLKKHIFYRQVYDAYFDSHDLSKGDSYIHDKCSRLDIDDFERVLRFVGYRCLRFQKIEFEKDALLQIISEAKEFCIDLDFNTSDFFTDLLTAVPLFCKDGQYFRWVHKSLQEYFAAQFIYKDAKGNQDAILTALYNSENLDKYINLLDIYFDVDNWGFKKNILFPLCKSYVEFYDRNIYSSSLINEKIIDDRIGYLFMREVCILKVRDSFDPFREVRERTQELMQNEISSMTHFQGDNVCTSNYFNPRRKLLPLLVKRQSNLFVSYSPIIIPNIDVLPIDKVIRLDAHSGDDNYELFSYYNHYLRGGSHEYTFYLKYDTCKKEVVRIRNIIKKKEESSALIEGL